MVFLKQTVQAIEKFYIPLEACNVPQFAFAAFSRVAAGYKVNSSWGRCVEGETNSHKTLKSSLISHFRATQPVKVCLSKAKALF